MEDVVMWPKYGNSFVPMREVIMKLILCGFDQKKRFFEGGLGSSSITWHWH